MARFEITGPDGARYEVTAPDGADEQQVLDYFKSQTSNAGSFNPAPMVKPDEGTGSIPAFLEGAAQGATFGFSDEIEGGARALYGRLTGDKRSFGELYGESVAKPRERIKRASDTNPWAYYSGEVGGGVAMPGGLARVGVRGALARSAGQPLGRRSVAAAKEGMAYGAAYGAGKSEGGLENIATGTALGAGTGAAFGLVLPGAVDVAGAIGTRIAAPFRGYANPQAVAAEKFGEAVARDLPDNIGGAPRFAEHFDDMQSVSPSARVMDAGGDNVRGLMRAAVNMPNKGRNRAQRIMDARQTNQWIRIEKELSSTLAPGRAFGEVTDEIVAQRAKEATPAFERAYSAPFNVRPDDDLTRFLRERGYMRRLVEKADETISGMTGKSAPDSITGRAPQATAAQASDLAQIKSNIGPLQPGEAESILEMHRFVRQMADAKAPESLTSFMHRKGGLQDQGGEIMRILGNTKQRPALIRRYGQQLDDAALRAYEAGYFPRRPTIDEFLNALDDDAKGLDRVVRQVDMQALDDFRVATEMADDLGRMGITSRMPEDLLRQALGMSAPQTAGQAAKVTRPWEFLHRVKMEIDREIGRLKRGQQDSKANWTKNDLIALQREFQGMMEKHNPHLGSAMKRYSDQSSLARAAEDGFDDFLTMPIHEMRKHFAKLSPADKELYRLGASRAIMDRIERGNVMGDRTDNLFSSPQMQLRLAAIMDQNMRRTFQKHLTVEAKMADSRKALQGNSTTAKQLAEGAEAGKTATAVLDVMNAAGGSTSSALNLLARGYNRFTGLTPPVAKELLDLGLSQNPAVGQALAQRSIEQAAKTPAQRAAMARALTAAGVSPTVTGVSNESTDEQRKRALARQLLSHPR